MAKAKSTAPAGSLSHQLFKALEKVDRPGTFCASGSLAAVLPGLEVKGLGPVGLPLTDAQLEALKRKSEQAPYGKGTKTVVDTKVRRVWRLTPDRFALTNPEWGTFLKGIVEKVRAELGLEGQKLQAHLYDLLLYEPGSFFLPHRDGEKLDGMVATLVVGLPSKFEGGELVVRHEGEERVIRFAGPDSLYKIHYAAFYADCEHEVRPVKSGYRLGLVYNLTLDKAKKGKGGLGAPRTGEHVAEVAGILRHWDQYKGAPPKLAVTLAHRYTEDGLSWDALKGVDRTKARVLAEAAKAAGVQAYLGLLVFWESGSAESGYDDYSYRRYGRRRYYDYDEDDEDDEDDDDEEGDDGDVEGKYTMDEVFDSSLSAKHLLDPDGKDPGVGEIPVEQQEIVPPESLKAVKPQEDFEGYTGNAGMTLERWYRHGAVFLWPGENDLDVMLQSGSHKALGGLERMVADWRAAVRSGAGAAESLEARCLEFARKILAAWPARQESRWYDNWGRKSEADPDDPDPITALQKLDDPGLLREYFGRTLASDLTLEPGRAAVKAVVRHGWATFRKELIALFAQTNSNSIERNVRFLELLCEAGAATAAGQAAKPKKPTKAVRASPKPAGDLPGTEALSLCRRLAELTADAWKRLDAKQDARDWRAERLDRAKLLPALVQGLLSASPDDLLADAVDHVLKDAAHYPLREVQLPALQKLSPWVKKNNAGRVPAGLLRWLEACRAQLESFTSAEPQPPADFWRNLDFKATGGDAGLLKQFLHDPHQEVGRFQMAQDRRTHLEHLIRNQLLDVTFKTDRKPRPQVLVCTKNTATYERLLKQYRQDLKHLAEVRSMQPK